MVRKHIEQLRHYLPLFGIVFAGLLGFILFSYDKGFQIVLLIMVAVTYVAWGIIHHTLHDDLHLSTIIEYLAIATLGLVIVFSILFRS